MRLDGLTWKSVLDVLQTSALAAVVILFVAGWLVSRLTLERYILAPRDARIEALEEAMARRDEEMRKLLEQQAAALEAMSKVVDRLLNEHHGGD